MIQLLPEQAKALRELQEICSELRSDVVLIGAIAYRVWVHDEDRTTEDLDAVVALDLDEMAPLRELLTACGWRPDAKREHRWHSAESVRLDLMPVGPKARQTKELIWPVAETRMSLVGYDHVFEDAVECDIGSGLKARVVPLVTLVLLKIVSYMDDPETRQKDLQDIASIMDKFEEDGDRRFSDEVLDAGVQYDVAGAFLLGRDLARLCTSQDEIAVVSRFLRELSGGDHPTFNKLSRLAFRGRENKDELLVQEVAGLIQGFGDFHLT